MELFIIEDNEVLINAPYIKLIPQFRNLFNKHGKVAYDRNTFGIKRLTYIYFMADMSSPIMEYPEERRKEKALEYSKLTKEEVDDECVKEALKEYKELQIEGCRPIKTYHAAMLALDEMDNYFTNLDFSKTDKQGKLLYTPNQFTNNIGAINEAYTHLETLKKRINEQLKKSSGIRGSATLGDKEVSNKKQRWEESGSDVDKGIDWVEFGKTINNA